MVLFDWTLVAMAVFGLVSLAILALLLHALAKEARFDVHRSRSGRAYLVSNV